MSKLAFVLMMGMGTLSVGAFVTNWAVPQGFWPTPQVQKISVRDGSASHHRTVGGYAMMGGYHRGK